MLSIKYTDTLTNVSDVIKSLYIPSINALNLFITDLCYSRIEQLLALNNCWL